MLAAAPGRPVLMQHSDLRAGGKGRPCGAREGGCCSYWLRKKKGCLPRLTRNSTDPIAQLPGATDHVLHRHELLWATPAAPRSSLLRCSAGILIPCHSRWRASEARCRFPARPPHGMRMQVHVIPTPPGPWTPPGLPKLEGGPDECRPTLDRPQAIALVLNTHCNASPESLST